MRRPPRPPLAPKLIALIVLIAEPALTASLPTPAFPLPPPHESSDLLSVTHSANSTSDVFRQTLHSPALLLFAIESILLGLYLLGAGKRLWRLTCCLGLGFAFEIITWAAMVNLLHGGVFSQATATSTSLIEWAVVNAAGSLGTLLGDLAWMPGMIAMAAEAGCSLAFGVILVGRDDLEPLARWILLGVLSAMGLPLAFFQATFGMALATGLSGGFLLSLGIDLLVNPNTGMSLGLRYLMDKNTSDTLQLGSYSPPTSTRAIIAVGWALAITSAVLQTMWYREPFVRRTSLASREKRSSRSPRRVSFVPAQHHHSSSDAPQLAAIIDTHGSLGQGTPEIGSDVEMHERYIAAGRFASATPDSAQESATKPSPYTATGASPYAVHALAGEQHPSREYSHPEDAPTRPGSVVSTEFAMGLKSRPPTFMDLPLNASQSTGEETDMITEPIPGTELAPTALFSATSDPDTWQSAPVPIIAIGAAAAGATHDFPGLEALTQSNAHYTPMDQSGVPTDVGPLASAYLARGLSTGRQISLAPTGTTPSTGETSAVINSTFEQYPPALLPGGPGTPVRSSTMHGPPTAGRLSSGRTSRGASGQSPAPESDSSTATGEIPSSERGAVVHTPPLKRYFDSSSNATRPLQGGTGTRSSTFGSPDVPTDPSIAPCSPLAARASEDDQVEGYFPHAPEEAVERRVISDDSAGTMAHTDSSGAFASGESDQALSSSQGREQSGSTTTFGLPVVPPKNPKRASVRLSQIGSSPLPASDSPAVE